MKTGVILRGKRPPSGGMTRALVSRDQTRVWGGGGFGGGVCVGGRGGGGGGGGSWGGAGGGGGVGGGGGGGGGGAWLCGAGWFFWFLWAFLLWSGGGGQALHVNSSFFPLLETVLSLFKFALLLKSTCGSEVLALPFEVADHNPEDHFAPDKISPPP